jgi:hypothetical protein
VTGDGLASVTQESVTVTVPITTRNGVVMVELVDTPGLNDTKIPDVMMFKKIADYLNQWWVFFSLYVMELTPIIYYQTKPRSFWTYIPPYYGRDADDEHRGNSDRLICIACWRG